MKLLKLSFLIFVFLIVLGCKSSEEDKRDDAFTFIERNAYTINSYNGLAYYKLNKTQKFMDGYYVVGNKMSKWEEFEFKDGLLHGDYIVFHPNGEVSSHGQYSNGKKHGDELMYYQDGVLNSKQTFKNDVLVGSKYSYFQNGKVRSESIIEDGKAIETQNFDLLGNIVSQQFIRDSRTITQQIVEGKIYSEMVSSNYDSYETVKFYNEDGSTKIYLQKEEENGTFYILELDENGDEIVRVDVKANSDAAMKYFQYFN
ncbi:hypothetical protein ITJ86_04660 [Winogradskyella sp. F6397]|uniref:Toxin-antitoxin system YwqK family antitoxin n=1 Tax=Winogradskyella marina TaxID=2785530 RepID=A0ABS0EFE1_9FLAO|nr:hypothetical protein [Winogradskyella marina]MBF8149174.1 hypothetical protein [Winogradskyella marina]